jgi:hypothetical protein
LHATSIDPTTSPTCSTCIRGDLLQRWAEAAEDPGRGVCAWLRQGAPAGIYEFPELDAIFPISAKAGAPAVSPHELASDAGSFVNYQGFEHDDDAVSEVRAYADKGYLQRFKSLEEVREHLGAEPTISRFAVLKRVKNGKTKKRVILDLKQSSVSACTQQTHRVVLPRATDLVQDLLELLHRALPHEQVEITVLDYVDAFWNIPLRFSERRHFVGMARGEYFVYTRAAQGSRNGPLSWAAVISLVIRLTQGLFMFDEGATTQTTFRARSQTYVDDPALSFRGDRACRDRNLAVWVLAVRALGLPLAFHKAQRGAKVDWIGCRFEIFPGEVHVTLTADKVSELLELTLAMMQSNVTTFKDLRSFVGKATHFASILYPWRPFLLELWGALASTDRNTATNAPTNCIWTRQITRPLSWILAFLRGHAGAITMKYSVAAYHNLGAKVRIVTDASPWGLGGYLSIDDHICAFFATDVPENIAAHLSCTVGSHRSQQTFEALAIMIALRVWKPSWDKIRAVLEVRADNVAALTAVAKMKASGIGSNMIARELALDFCDGAFRPDLCVHTPGIASSIADSLSRKFQPATTFGLPALLSHVPESQIDWATHGHFRAREVLEAASASGTSGAS